MVIFLTTGSGMTLLVLMVITSGSSMMTFLVLPFLVAARQHPHDTKLDF